MTSGMLGSWGRSFRDVDARRRGFLDGGAGNGMSLEVIAPFPGRFRVGVTSSGDGAAEADVSSAARFCPSFSGDVLRSAGRAKSNVRGVGTSTTGEGIESRTPAAPMRLGRSWRLKGSTGVSLPSDCMVRNVSEDLLDGACETPLIRISRSRVGDRTSSTSSRLNNRTVSRSFALTDHFDRSFLATGRGGLPLRVFWELWDFCLFTFETEADLVGDFSGDRAGLEDLFLITVFLRGAGLLRITGAGGGLLGGVVMMDASPCLASVRPPVPQASQASWASCCTSCWTFSGRFSGFLPRVGLLFRLGGVGGLIGSRVAISSLSGRISRASRRSKVSFVGLGRDLTDLFFLVSVGSRGEGRGFSNGEPGGGDILLSLCVFERIDP